jgi:hypothetical protein
VKLDFAALLEGFVPPGRVVGGILDVDAGGEVVVTEATETVDVELA